MHPRQKSPRVVEMAVREANGVDSRCTQCCSLFEVLEALSLFRITRLKAFTSIYDDDPIIAMN
jgi:hypothetical protein